MTQVINHILNIAPIACFLQEGSRLCVTGRISEEWLYGECEGRVGQFPANFIDRIPQGLLQM